MKNIMYKKTIETTIFLYNVLIEIMMDETKRLGKHYNIHIAVTWNDLPVFDAMKTAKYESEKPQDSVLSWEFINGECGGRCFKNPRAVILSDRNDNKYRIEL